MLARGPQTRRVRNLEIKAIGGWAWVPLGTLGTEATTSNPGIQAICSWAEVPLGTQATTSSPGIQAIGSWAQVPLGTLGTQAATSNPGTQGQFYRGQVRTPPQSCLFCLGNYYLLHIKYTLL